VKSRDEGKAKRMTREKKEVWGGKKVVRKWQKKKKTKWQKKRLIKPPKKKVLQRKPQGRLEGRPGKRKPETRQQTGRPSEYASCGDTRGEEKRILGKIKTLGKPLVFTGVGGNFRLAPRPETQRGRGREFDLTLGKGVPANSSPDRVRSVAEGSQIKEGSGRKRKKEYLQGVKERAGRKKHGLTKTRSKGFAKRGKEALARERFLKAFPG